MRRWWARRAFYLTPTTQGAGGGGLSARHHRPRCKNLCHRELTRRHRDCASTAPPAWQALSKGRVRAMSELPNNVFPLPTRAEREGENARLQKEAEDKKAVSDSY